MKISIAEGLYLIALDDEEGRLLAAAEKSIVPGLISAALLELHLLKKVAIKDNVIEVLDQTGTGNGILDNILKKVKSGVGLIDAVENLAHTFKDIQEDLNELLVQRGILKKEATKLMWIPLSERMDNANYAFEAEIRKSLQAIVFKSAKPTNSFVILMSLIYDCNILDEVFRDKDELIDAVKVAKDIVNSPVVSEDVSKALKVLKAHFQK
ncbi:GOLPH3/VPS74 family protein [Marinoscillum furvescens]|uniref:Golgi phosphoprotein 3 GPP34 n=1 Tax=Marinoscillum furvescens DSM 4134 TaxID=1122208 RepID=A0A3D9L9L2_MARFU|nr:GPP34 family phosphoprotein [Marinoscillum furvescens]REE02157.1 Golgi phosphoprotein 3 GPP34 [Marinoscillum furvescens DSM 4134]